VKSDRETEGEREENEREERESEDTDTLQRTHSGKLTRKPLCSTRLHVCVRL